MDTRRRQDGKRPSPRGTYQASWQNAGHRERQVEVNIREAIILGYVGAGGLGQQIQIAISLLLENKLLTLILAIYLMVTLVDYLSAYLRRRLL